MSIHSVSRFSAAEEMQRIAEEGQLGVIAGSGPEAGADLWMKILNGRRTRLGSAFRGDIDAPQLAIRSIPSLGLSMDMEKHAESLRSVVHEVASEMASCCVAYTIACNTLHYFSSDLAKISGGKFVSVQSVVREELRARGKREFALLGASPVMALGRWSPYADLQNEFKIETANGTILDELIYAVKTEGGSSFELARQFKAIVDSLECEFVVIGCTELPLVTQLPTKHTLLDVTSLLAEALLNELSSVKHSTTGL